MIILAACARSLILDANAVQLQASPSETLELTAVFDATLVFHVWQTIWHTSLIHTGHTEEAFSIKTMWAAAADLLADEPSWIVLQLNSQTTLSGYVALDPADKFQTVFGPLTGTWSPQAGLLSQLQPEVCC